MNERSVQHTTFVIERTYSASPARVFAAWANPEAKAQWFPKADEFDFRVGGREVNRGTHDRGVYGSPRVHAELQAQGIKCARKRVAQLMREQGLCAKRPRHRTVTTRSDPEAQAAPNLLQRNFSAERPNTKWVADTTSIWTAEGWLYLAVVLDLFSRMVVGRSMSATQDATLVVQALRMAIARRRPSPGLLHHSDRGSTYTSESYQLMLTEAQMVVSMSRTADCYDNAAMESFFHSLKGECLDRQSFQTRAQARSVTFDYLETFYNRIRRHSTLQYLSPLSYEQSMS